MFKFSIIIPVYNTEKYLKECLESIIYQDERNIEIIIVNDGSTDKSKQICEEYKKKDNRINLINKNNGGVSSARNRGIEEANGKYIIFVDSDDHLQKNFFKEINEIIEQNNVDLIIHSITEVGLINEKNICENMISLIKKEWLNCPWNKIYKKQIIVENNLRFDEKIQIGEDLLFNIQYMQHVKNIYKLNKRIIWI